MMGRIYAVSSNGFGSAADDRLKLIPHRILKNSVDIPSHPIFGAIRRSTLKCLQLVHRVSIIRIIL